MTEVSNHGTMVVNPSSNQYANSIRKNQNCKKIMKVLSIFALIGVIAGAVATGVVGDLLARGVINLSTASKVGVLVGGFSVTGLLTAMLVTFFIIGKCAASKKGLDEVVSLIESKNFKGVIPKKEEGEDNFEFIERWIVRCFEKHNIAFEENMENRDKIFLMEIDIRRSKRREEESIKTIENQRELLRNALETIRKQHEKNRVLRERYEALQQERNELLISKGIS